METNIQILQIEKMYPNSKLPDKAHKTDSGFDLYAYDIKKVYAHNGSNAEDNYETEDKLSRRLIDDEFTVSGVELQYLERVLIGTGLKIAVPEGFEAQIRPRSGLALDDGITVLNSPGTVDSGYRGELSVILINLSRANKRVRVGERVAQLVIVPVQQVSLEVVKSLSESDRNDNGFGSTGR